MFRRIILALLIVVRFVTSAHGQTTENNSPESLPADQGWPRQHSKNSTTLVTYQPQVDEWKDFKSIEFRMAFSITPKGGKPVLGAMSVEGQTDVDNDAHMVFIHDLKIRRSNLPSANPAQADALRELLPQFLPATVDVSLERIVAATPKKQIAPAVQLKNDAPRIFISYQPAVLLDVDGDPVFVPIKDTGLEYIMNTTWRVIRDKANARVYLLAGDQWLTAAELIGPWTAASQLPKDLEIVAKDAHFADMKDFVPLPAAKPGAVIPKVFFTAAPTDAILFDGQPVYASIKGTQLSYATNTVSYLFIHAHTKQVYYLTGGRWFSAPGFEGPWTFATPSLPKDFAQIPRSSPAAQVLASVPGTEEAKDAVLMAQIPTTATVDPKAAAASAKAIYDGEPKFAPIEGTSMQYATNTSNKVIKVKDVYYLCLQGAWFFATAPEGPWQTAPSVPDDVYAIPPSSPVYNVTYVTQTALPDGAIEASYTAGYEGAYITDATEGLVIVGGTGWYYPPYIGYYPGYYGYPPYYGYPYAYGSTAWYNSATGRYGVSQTAYGPYGSASRGASYNPYTGTATRSASVSTPYGRAFAGQAYNPYTGAYGATRQGSTAYSQWGSSVVAKNGRAAYTQHYSNARGTVGSIQGSQGGAAIGAAGANGNSGFVGKTGNGDMYAGRDGNLYRNTGNGWQKYENGGWNSADKPAPKGAESRGWNPDNRSADRGAQTQNLRNESMSRQRGMDSTQRFQQRSFSGFGGGRSFGGRRR